VGRHGQLWAIALFLFFYIAHIREHLTDKLGLNALPSTKWLDDLHSGEPLTPLHKRTETIPHGVGFGISEKERSFFADFTWFADVLNEWFARAEQPWRLQALADTDVSEIDDLDPVNGRRYKIFYNHHEIGHLAIRPWLTRAQNRTFRPG
jgi:hypothetical protein